MKLYIFRCRTRPKMYGATRYETASNLPTNKCSGWEFHERVDLKPGGRLRFAVDTETVRRGVEQRGWHVWDEAPWQSWNESRESAAQPEHVRPIPSESGAVESEEFTQEVPKQAAQTMKGSPVEIEKEMAAKFELLEPKPLPEPDNSSLEKWAKQSRKEAAESVPTPPRREPPAVERETGKSIDRSRQEAAEPARQASRQQRPAAEVRTGASAAAPAPSKKISPRPIPEHRPAPDVSPARPVQKLQAEKIQAEKIETPRSIPKPPARHQVVWFDIPVRDIDRAIRFYSAVLGTSLKKQQAGPGAALALLPHQEGAIGGSLVQNMDARPSDSGPLIYLNAQGRLDEAIDAASAHGGKVLAEKHSIAPFGFRAIILDSEGNRIALHSD